MNFSNNLIDGLITFFKNLITEDFFLKSEEFLINLASLATPVAAATGALMGLIVAIKTDSFIAFMAGIAWIVLLVVGYYVGSKFLNSCKTLVQNNPTNISSKEYIDVIALISICSIIGVSLGGFIISIKMGSFEALKWTGIILVALIYSLCFALHPNLVSTTIGQPATAGRDAIAIIAYGYKSSIRLAGIVFGASVFFGTVYLLFGLIDVFKSEGFGVLMGGMTSIGGVVQILVGLSYPFIAYLIFLLFYLSLDLMSAILSIKSSGFENQSAVNFSSPQTQEASKVSELKLGLNPTNSSINPTLVKNILVGLIVTVVVGGGMYAGWQYKLELDRKAEITRQEEFAKAEEIKRQEELAKAEEMARAEEVKRQEELALAEEARRKAQANLVLPAQCGNHFNSSYNNPAYRNHKAYAVAFDGVNAYCTMQYNSSTVQLASQQALQACEQNKFKNKVNSSARCYVYRAE